MAILAVFGKNAMGLALFHALAVMTLIWLTIGGHRVLPHLFIFIRRKDGNPNLE
jgi:hypothetical protein